MSDIPTLSSLILGENVPLYVSGPFLFLGTMTIVIFIQVLWKAFFIIKTDKNNATSESADGLTLLHDEVLKRLDDVQACVFENQKMFVAIMSRIDELEERMDQRHAAMLKRLGEIDEVSMEVKREMIFLKKSNAIKSRRNSIESRRNSFVNDRDREGDSASDRESVTANRNRRQSLPLMLETNFEDSASPSTFYLPENEVKQARGVAVPKSSAQDKPVDFGSFSAKGHGPTHMNTHLSPMQPQFEAGQTQTRRQAQGATEREGLKEHLTPTPTSSATGLSEQLTPRW